MPLGTRGIIHAIGTGTNSPGGKGQVEVNYTLEKPRKDGAVTYRAIACLILTLLGETDK